MSSSTNFPDVIETIGGSNTAGDIVNPGEQVKYELLETSSIINISDSLNKENEENCSMMCEVYEVWEESYIAGPNSSNN